MPPTVLKHSDIGVPITDSDLDRFKILGEKIPAILDRVEDARKMRVKLSIRLSDPPLPNEEKFPSAYKKQLRSYKKKGWWLPFLQIGTDAVVPQLDDPAKIPPKHPALVQWCGPFPQLDDDQLEWALESSVINFIANLRTMFG